MKKAVYNLAIGAAVANQGGAMEADTISKHGRNSKSHTSRGNILNICMNSMKFIFLMFIAFAILSSCSPTQKRVSVKTVDITHTGVIQKPVIVDLQVGQTKVRGSAIGASSELQRLKNEAVKDALNNAGNADVLVEPNFTTSSTGYRATVEVTGYPATYKNFRAIEANDTIWLNNSRDIYQAKVYDTREQQQAVKQQQRMSSTDKKK